MAGFGDAGEGEQVVIDERGLVLGQPHFFHTPVEPFTGGFDALARILGGLFVVDMQVREFLAGLGVGAEGLGVVARQRGTFHPRARSFCSPHIAGRS